MSKNKLIKKAVLTLVFFGSVFLFALTDWMDAKFGVVTVDQILFHAFYFKMDGSAGDPELIKSFVRGCLLLPLVISILLGEVFAPSRLTLNLVLQRLRRTPRLHVSQFRKWIPVTLLVAACVNVAFSFRFDAYLSGLWGSDFFGDHYAYPSRVKIERVNPKNLILIYVESLENVYSQPQLFGRDLLASLNTRKSSQVSFENFVQLPGTGWTIAGIVATQCGIPLKPPSFILDMNRQSSQMSGFLSNATCLGDILAGHGYRNVFMGGASLEFAGKGRFFEGHRYDEVVGRDDWYRMGYTQADMNDWGLFDDLLLDEAKKKLEELMARDQLFNLTILTVDTHFPDGHVSKTCSKKGAKELTGILECTADQLAEFIDFTRSKGWSDKIQIVILGDHLSLKNSVYEKVQSDKNRTIYNLFVSSDPGFKKVTDDVNHFDMFPTILDFIGFRVQGDRLGLGYSALHDHEVPKPIQLSEDMKRNLLNYSPTYLELWGGSGG
jgi:phosphoglycerol transferase